MLWSLEAAVPQAAVRRPRVAGRVQQSAVGRGPRSAICDSRNTALMPRCFGSLIQRQRPLLVGRIAKNKFEYPVLVLRVNPFSLFNSTFFHETPFIAYS